MFSKLSKVTVTMSMGHQFARQMLRANEHTINVSSSSRWISTSGKNKRSDVLTQNQQNNNNDKLKLEQQERVRTRRTER